MEETDNICFVCDKTIPTERWKYKLQVTATKRRNVPVSDLIQQLVGDECAVLVGERDAVCSRCMNLLNLMDSLTAQMEDVRKMLTYLLHSKYNLASESVQVEFDNTTHIETEPIHKCDSCNFETKYEKEFNMHLRTHESLVSNMSDDKFKINRKKPKSKFAKGKKESSTSKIQKKRQKKEPKPKRKKIVFQCSVCDRIFPNENAIKSHAKNDHGNDNIFVTSDDEYEDIQTLESSEEKMSDSENTNTYDKEKPLDKVKLDFLDDWLEDNSNDETSVPTKKQKIDGKTSEVKKKRGRPRKKSVEEDYDNDSSSKPTCLFCHATFSSLEAVQDHIQLSHGNKAASLRLNDNIRTSSPESIDSFEIDSTTDIVENKSKLNSNDNNLPSTKKSYKCKLCGIKKVSLQFIQNHIRLHKRKLALQCKLCGISFKNIVAIKIHASKCVKVASMSIKCGYCNFKFFDRSQLRNHILKVHKKSSKLMDRRMHKKTAKDIDKTKPVTSNDNETNSNQKKVSESGSSKISSSEVTSTSIETETNDWQEEKPFGGGQSKENFTCGECSFSFKKRSRLLDHLNRHKASKCLDLGICIYCEKLFIDKRQLIIHTNLKHENFKTSAKCPVCMKVYAVVRDMRIHYLRAHYNKKTEELMNLVQCEIKKNKSVTGDNDQDASDVYTKVFKELQDLTGEGNDSDEVTLNGKAQTASILFNCPLCTFNSSAQDELRNHFISHTQNYCNICKQIFSPEESIKHIENHNIEFSGKSCPSCEDKFHDDIHLQCHVEIDHPGTRPFKCSMCAKSFVTEKSMLTHKQIQHGKECRKKLSCIKCKMSFFSEKQHEIHTEFAHRTVLNCKYCDKNISDLKKLVVHEKNHLKQVRSIFKCNTCGKVLKTQSALKTHKLNHISGNSFNCDVCSRSFKSFHSLREHSAKHSEGQEKKFFCDICGKGFYFYDSHYRHRRIHLDPLLYQCKICRARFQTKQKLVEHNHSCSANEGEQCKDMT